jgi:hypothetical protein
MKKGHRDTETDEKTLLELIMAMFQKNLQNPPIQKLLKTLSLHWLVNSSVIMVHSCQKCPIDKEGKGAIVPLNFFKSQSLIQVNLVIFYLFLKKINTYAHVKNMYKWWSKYCKWLTTIVCINFCQNYRTELTIECNPLLPFSRISDNSTSWTCTHVDIIRQYTIMYLKITKLSTKWMSFLILNKYWECHEITEYLKNYSWSKHVKQKNSF